MKINNVYVGNNLEVLKTFPDNSIDSVVTDPPYGLGKEPNAIEVLQSWITTGYHEVKGKGFMGKEWDAFVPQPNFWKEIYRVLKPGGHVLSFAGTRTYDWMVMAVRLAGFEIRDMIAWLYGSGFPKSHNISKALDKKGSDNAKQWQGWGTALKPALEPIVMARKPLDGTVAQNVLKHGVGGINIDESRVPTSDKATFPEGDYGESNFRNNIRTSDPNPDGRFPANVIHDGSDEVVSLFPYTESGKMTSQHQRHTDGSPNGIYGKFDKEHPLSETYGDSGSAARFFYKAKASKKERNLGLEGFEEKVSEHNSGGIGRKTSVEKRTNMSGTNAPKMKNIHPTVKPINLMRYLVRLVTPPNGICLDPYLGSGTTAIACEMEKFSWIGIELIPEYVEIAKARIAAVKDYEATLYTSNK